jgi:hypothetical protein
MICGGRPVKLLLPPLALAGCILYACTVVCDSCFYMRVCIKCLFASGEEQQLRLFAAVAGLKWGCAGKKSTQIPRLSLHVVY